MSIDDQIALCKAKIEQFGWTIEKIFHDSAISGSTPLAYREGGRALLAEIDRVSFDVLVLEGLDRLSRDQVEQEQVVRRLEYRGIRIVGVCDGYDSKIASRKVLRSVRGLVNELYIDDLREKTHRGLTGQITRGYCAGGKSYGYNLIKEEKGSRYEINEDEAQWVRFIFDEYGKGVGIQRIVNELNRLKVPSPRGTQWVVSAIYGSPTKGSGILNNHLYIGELIWNRSKWVKDPDTGQRKRVDRPQSEWVIKELPELSIVDDISWARVRKRMDAGRGEDGRKRRINAPKTLLGGILKCPYCGGSMFAVCSTHYGCLNHKNKGEVVCEGITIQRKTAERRLVDYIKTKLLNDEAIALFEKEFKLALQQYDTGSQAVDDLKERLSKINSGIDRIVESITEIGHSEALASKLKKLEEEKSVVILHLTKAKKVKIPDIKEVFSETLNDLSVYLEEDREKARSLLKELFGEIPLIDSNGAVFAMIDKEKMLLPLLPKNTPFSGGGCEGRI